MSTVLSKADTKLLRDVSAMIDYVYQNGYSPEAAEDHEPKALYTQAHLRKTRKNLRELISKKGHHSA